ncbi:ankyrin repeat domain-containing protein [Campylobacter coli]|uniref:ankyrin repeat domain-containing protein n=1 Tax=Campylobacter coli TaxID=195 RepID=UPI001F438239|nr:ankyrin repeat domain-containing protein [Campylobacter coli]
MEEYEFESIYKYQDTPLFEAVKESENYRTVQLLIELGANVNFVPYLTTPLDQAEGARNRKLLKAAGAMTSDQLEKKFNIFYKDYEDRNEYCDLLNEAIRKDKEKENLQKKLKEQQWKIKNLLDEDMQQVFEYYLKNDSYLKGAIDGLKNMKQELL